MVKTKRNNMRELGLEVAAVIGESLWNIEHLHYGYWTDELEVDIAHLRAAQEQYSAFLLSQLPKGVHSILDVGCGTGRLTAALADLGYRVDGVSPCPRLNEHARLRLGSRGHVYDSRFETLDTEKRYDLILFSESFQYLKQTQALKQCQRLLTNGGCILICDFFRQPGKSKGMIGGGHDIDRFNTYVSSLPLECLTDIDITDHTAPNLDLVHDFMRHTAVPVSEILVNHLRLRYPTLARLLLWKYRKKINRVYGKYLNGGRTAAEFRRTKTYRLLLYRKVLHEQAKQTHSRDLAMPEQVETLI